MEDDNSATDEIMFRDVRLEENEEEDKEMEYDFEEYERRKKAKIKANLTISPIEAIDEVNEFI